MDRLYVVVRDDLAPGLQAAQAVHAVCMFEGKYPEKYQAWARGESNIVLLSVPNKKVLEDLLFSVSTEYCAASFTEPDLGNERTAVAFEGAAHKALSSLPLALRRFKIQSSRGTEAYGGEGPSPRQDL